MDINIQIEQFTTAVMTRYTRFSDQDKAFLEGVARKQLNALGAYAGREPTFDNVLSALITIVKSSKLLGQISINHQIEHWIEFRNRSELTGFTKIATFLKMVLDSGHPDGILGLELMKTFETTTESELHCVWDVLCVFPLIIY